MNRDNSRIKTEKTARNGFVLVWVVFFIALSSLVIGGFAINSLKNSVDASSREREIQKKWNWLSCQRVSVEIADALLDTHYLVDYDGSLRPPKALKSNEIRVEIQGREFFVLIQDESAKIDINSIRSLVSLKRSEDIVDRCVASDELSVLIREGDWDGMFGASFYSLLSWDQVFEGNQGRSPTPLELMKATKDLTLWGGRLNYLTASDNAIRQLLNEITGPVFASRFLAIRTESPNLTLNEAILAATPSEAQHRMLMSLLGEKREAVSIWTVWGDDNGRGLQYSLLVRKNFGNGVNRYYSFFWP